MKVTQKKIRKIKKPNLHNKGYPLPEEFTITNKKTGKSVTFTKKHDKQKRSKKNRYA